MATKRPHPSIHPSRTAQVPVEASEPSRKRRKPNLKANTPGAKTFKKAHPVNELKSRVRSLKRQLERNDSLSAVDQQEKERALRHAEEELGRNERAKKRSDLIGKWHKVRFFERRGAEKRVKRARKELNSLDEGDGEEREVLEQRVRDAEVDLNYAVYFPLEREYVPLFPRKKTEAGDEDDAEDGKGGEAERQGDPVMWQTVKRCMEEGTLDALRNGRLDAKTEGGDEEVGTSHTTKTKKRPKQSSKAQRPEEGAESEEESDGRGNAFWE